MAGQLVLDTSSLTYRAFFALPTSIRDPEGRAVNAVRGYLDMVANLIADRHPHEVLHVFDADWRPAERVAAYEGYKSARNDDPPELPWQFQLLRQVLTVLGQVAVEAPGWEADDAIGVLCARARDEDRVEVVTGDRDLIQLVRDPVVKVLFTVRGVTQLTTFDEDGVRAKYGIPAHRYADFAILRGDPSDGLPGIRGVGEKTARELVLRYPTLDALVEDAGSQTPRLAASLRDAGGYIAAMRAVVPVRTDVPLEVAEPARDDASAAALGEAHNVAAPIGRFLEALDAAGAAAGA